MDVSVALARLDALHARRVGEMLVTQDAPEYEVDPEAVLLDVARLDGKELLTQFNKQYARFGTVPFDPLGSRIRLYGGGVTIWSGYPASGKTSLLRQLICHLLHRGSSVFLASLEENPRNALVRIAATAAGCETDKLTVHQMQWFIDAYAERFRLWGIIGLAQHKRLLAVCRKLSEVKIRHVIIDSLMCLDIANDNTEAQRCFANLTAATARIGNMHIHLVAHPRKLVSADQDLDINDVAGARELTGMADNVGFMRRAKNESHDPNASVTPMCISWKKQRHYHGWHGDVTGWYHRNLQQFSIDQFATEPMHYLPDDAYKDYGDKPL